MKDFYGFVATLSGEVCGGALGYRVSEKDTISVAFSNLDLPNEFKNSFYLAECFLKPKFQSRGIGNMLMRQLSEEEQNTCFRTTNPNMIKSIE